MVPLRRVTHALRGPAGIAVLAGALAIALRLPFLLDAPYADEGGLLVVASRWHDHGPFLYGPLFVDRPPLLLAFFRLADVAGGLVMLRALGLVLVAGSVALAARAGAVLAGTRGAAAAAPTCAALLADPRLGTREIDAETVGVPMILLAAVLSLEAVRRAPSGTRTVFLVGAGIAGSAAVLVKQNLVDGLVFAVVLVVATGIADTAGVRRTAGQVCLVMLGAAVPPAVALAWSATATGAHGLWYTLYGFRLAGSSALFATTSAARAARLQGLGRAAVLSGMAALLVVCVMTLLRRRRSDAATVALVAMLVAEVAGAAGGGYYWPHYLIGIVPATALLAAKAAAVRRPWLLGLAVTATLVSSAVAVIVCAAGPTSTRSTEVAALSAWLDRAARPGDSAVVLYGEASVFDATPLRPAYPFLWTLPQRILDPHLTRLVHTLDRRSGPTYVVVRMPLDSYGQDPHGRVHRAIERHYQWVARVDADSIFRRRGTISRRSRDHFAPVNDQRPRWRTNTTTPTTASTTATARNGHGDHSSVHSVARPCTVQTVPGPSRFNQAT